jgi:hypothetical protein
MKTTYTSCDKNETLREKKLSVETLREKEYLNPRKIHYLL